MIKKFKNYLVALAMVMAAGAPVVITAGAYADNAIQQSVCSGVNTATQTGTGVGANTGCTGGTDAATKVSDIARLVVNILSIIVGVVAVVMIIVGGFKYITSGGDTGKVGGAKNTIIYAIIGLILVALAQIIVNVVLDQSSKLS